MTGHVWIKSTLGHGNYMCARCLITDREAEAIGCVECSLGEDEKAKAVAKVSNSSIEQPTPMFRLVDETKQTYIGDGVYASFDGFQIWLRTNRLLGGLNEIALDPHTFKALLDYAETVPMPTSAPMAPRVNTMEGEK